MTNRITNEDDAEVEHILAMSDEEVLETLWETGETPEDVADRMRAIFTKVVADADRRRRAIN